MRPRAVGIRRQMGGQHLNEEWRHRTVRRDASDLGSSKKNWPLLSTSEELSRTMRRRASNRSTWSALNSLKRRPCRQP